MQIRSRAPNLNQRRCIEFVYRLIKPSACANVVFLQISKQPRRMARCAIRLQENLLSSFRSLGKFAVYQIGTGHGFERFEVLVYCSRNFFWLLGEENMTDASPDSGFCVGAHAQPH